jgi:hypothetical protein
MKNIYLTFIFTFSLLHLNAQQQAVQVKYEQKSDNSVNFSYSCNSPGNHFLLLKFINLQNSNYFQKGHNIHGRLGTLTTLKPMEVNKPINFQYTYSFWKGKGLKEYKNTKQYLMPYQEGKKVKVNTASHLGQFFDQKVPDSWLSYSFNSEAPDSIFAARKGEVVEVTNIYKNDTTEHLIYTKNRNEIVVEHEDGTLGKYSGLEYNKIKVKEGDIVLPGSFLGIVGREGNDPKNYLLFFTLYYLNISKMTSEPGENRQYGIEYIYVTPKFFNTKMDEPLVPGIYEVKYDRNIIISEMSKKEKKKFFENMSN